ncbi:epithelial-stromal interaction protein 1 isoform 2-T2 [Anomaloglossus baeobatrachus]|uniref:epithelial-stromal interaction protein 1 isoform X1 n=1 Tax=Anomaloglossus baeobatrachus TaxID=238106 RepID=UPI003F50A15C
MYGQRQSMYGRGRNIKSLHDYQSQSHEGEEQNSDPQQNGRNEQQTAQAPQTSQESQYSSPYQVTQPNPTRREKLLRMAREEQEEYDHYKQSQSHGRIDLAPSRLGGHVSESEARQQQQRIQSQSKYQKMIQRENDRRKQKEEEEAKNQEMKDIQRKKAEKLEKNRQKQDMERKEKWHEDRQKRNKAFLDQLQPKNPDDRHFGYSSEWAIDQDEDFDNDLMFDRALEESMITHKTEEEARLRESKKHQHKQENQQAVNQYRTMGEMYREDDWPEFRAVNQDEEFDDDLMKALKESMKMHKTEEEARLRESKKHQHKQPIQKTYKQQQKEEEERRLKEMKEEQHRKTELLQMHEEQRRLSQEEERRRVNKAFLDRLDRLQNKNA